jgi:hypothetical protein
MAKMAGMQACATIQQLFWQGGSGHTYGSPAIIQVIRVVIQELHMQPVFDVLSELLIKTSHIHLCQRGTICPGEIC